LTMQKVFWKNVIIIHSSISEANKTKNWVKIYSWEAKVIIGTRSALFYPYVNLGRIIIDEEHDRSYRSDNAPRYNATEVATKISALQSIPLLMWSGTPSTSTMYKAVKKQIWLVTLLEEYNK
jgi:primosomal protein N' (replication factor Y)